MSRTSALIIAGLCFPAWAHGEIDAVAEGKKVFELFGCMVCHGVAKDDAAQRTGPPLHGLFLSDVREREVLDPISGERRMVKADKGYYLDSIRKSMSLLAVAESGPAEGDAYPAAMPSYSREVISDPQVEFMWHYLRTLADEGQAGPSSVPMQVEEQEVAKSILEIPNEEVVTQRTRVFRAPLRGASGRALHVGLPSGMNFTFDPRVLSVRSVWGGGFLNLTSERTGRGQPGSERGFGNVGLINGGGILQPLSQSGEPIDFEFKEPDVLDDRAVERWLWDKRDFLDLLAGIDAEFLGHELDSSTGDPVFGFRVGKNEWKQKVSFTEDGRLEIALRGDPTETQRFNISDDGLDDVTVTSGSVSDGVWTLDPAKGPVHTFSARLRGGLIARAMPDRTEDWSPQPLKRNDRQLGDHETRLPAGYSIENWESPRDLYGREQLFEPTGIAVAKDGTIVISTRTAGVWRIRDDQWTLFAEGTYEALGVVIEDDKGDQIVVLQKPELTRMTDRNGDGRADRFETLCDDFGFHGNYHEYAHGPVRDAEGNYYFTLNLCHNGDDRSSWRAGGPFMGTMGGYRGWACRVTPDGKFEPFAKGLRSPAGIGIDREGRIWYAENQGEYVGSSHVVPLEQGAFYGHISGLVDLPGGMTPDSPELHFDHWKDKIRDTPVWLPHGKMANAPGHPEWDHTGGKFGVYGGQMFIGDQTLSTLLRVGTEVVNGADQGWVVPFARGMASGVMRPCFLPDGSLLLGQTGRGWGARGGRQDALQRITYDGKTVAADIHRLASANVGFVMHLTQTLVRDVKEEDVMRALKMRSWYYTNTGAYGSPEHDRRDDQIAGVRISSDRKAVQISLDGFGEGDRWINRVYEIKLSDTAKLFGDAPVWGELEGYFTLRAIPE